MQHNQISKSILQRIRCAGSHEEIDQLLSELGGYGKASDTSIRRARRAAKRRIIELEESK
jgi:hypothetical protein